LGDSRAVLYREMIKKDKNIEKQAIELSYDHKPTRSDERDRITRYGGKIDKILHDG